MVLILVKAIAMVAGVMSMAAGAFSDDGEDYHVAAGGGDKYADGSGDYVAFETCRLC